jgi:hypothetical protein
MHVLRLETRRLLRLVQVGCQVAVSTLPLNFKEMTANTSIRLGLA